MKLLAISDEVVDWIYSPALLQRCADVDLVISCGDLPIHYLEFVTSTLNVPCYYVRGNHDHYTFGHGGMLVTEPPGWINLDLHYRRWQHLTLAGIEGCIRYKPAVPIQYTQGEQWWRVLWLAQKLLAHRLIHRQGVDIIVAHSPAYGIHDGPDRAHTGFRAFNWLIAMYRPRLFLHGHQHRNYHYNQSTETVVDSTRIVNIHPYRILEFD